MFRGTFRYPGWCHTWKCLWKVGLLDRSPRPDLEGRTFAAVLAELAGAKPGPTLRAAVAKKAGVAASDPAMDHAEWLGMFSDHPMGKAGTLLDCVADLLLEKLFYAEGERDMLLMKHEFVAAYADGSKERIVSTMLDFGIPGGDTSMARTVSLPAAIGVRLILEGRVAARGVVRPVSKELYEPVLDELATLGISLKEDWSPA
jgi:saccharopine dehydrogenase-like NADP-dependent oxidoreductase